MTKEKLLKLADLPKKERINEIARLRAEGKISEQEYYEILRPAIEAKRGFTRDVNFFNVGGNIIRSKKWIKDRVVFLNQKKAEFGNRIKNIENELKKYEK